MKQRLARAIVVACLVPAPAFGEVSDAAPGGFTTVHEIVVDATREEAWHAAVMQVGQWWSDDHTVSGTASRMSIDPRPLGCFCESLDDDAGVVHLTVTFVNPNVMLRMTGGLGPLGLMGVNGNMTWEMFEADGGTRVRFTYVVGGYRPGGLEEIAAPVDYVVGEALGRLKAHVETGDANRASVD